MSGLRRLYDVVSGVVSTVVLILCIVFVAISLGASPAGAILGTLIFAGLFFGHGHD